MYMIIFIHHIMVETCENKKVST